MKIAILGYGVEGRSAEKFLKRAYRGVRIEVRDIKKQGKDYLKNLDSFDMVVRSPGIPYLLPEIQRAVKKGVNVTSTTKLFFHNAKGVLVGITGTKGKGTTSTILYNILKDAGHDAHLIGNMGIPMLDELPKLKEDSVSILELSSFQLQDMDVSPHIAVVLDVSPDHMNYHKSMKEYVDAKSNLVKNTTSKLTHSGLPALNPLYGGSDARTHSGTRSLLPLVLFFPDNKFSKQIAQKRKGKKIAVKADKTLKLKIPGIHNLKNASMAAAVAGAFGVPKAAIGKTIRSFKGLPHRLEFVREIRGVKFYNDSASTNPAATCAAIKAFAGPIILIAGGAGKNLDYSPIGKALKNSNTRFVVLNGENQKEIGRAIGKAAPIIFTEDLKKAIDLAFKNAVKGDVIILSPASTGFDQFSGYGARGDFFRICVAKLK